MTKLQFFSPVHCDALSLNNGQVSYSNEPSEVDGKYPFATVASFSCNIEYYVSRSEEATCESSGNWNMDPPECKPSKYIYILKIEHRCHKFPCL